MMSEWIVAVMAVCVAALSVANVVVLYYIRRTVADQNTALVNVNRFMEAQLTLNSLLIGREEEEA